MPRKLTKLRITEVASVDRGAGEGVKVVLTKRGSAMPNDDADGLTKFLARRLEKARTAFSSSIESIFRASDDAARVRELVDKSAGQFVEHVGDLAGDIASSAELGGEIGKGDDMSPDILKALGLDAGASAEAMLKAIETLKAAKPKENGGDGDEEEKKKRAADEEAKKKAAEAAVVKELPPEIRKILDESAVLKAQVDSLTKAAQLETFKKKAIAHGLAETHGEILMKAYGNGGDPAAIETILGFLKAAGEQAKEAGIFKEFGASTGGESIPETAIDALRTKAAELRKADPKLSADQAFAKVYTDPENAKLAARERAENRPHIVS